MTPPSPTRAWLRRAAALAGAAWLSFAAASLLHVDHAFWAAMPTWVLAQSSRGLVLERGLFRLLGTLIGAGFGLLVLQLPIPVPAQCLLLALWLGAQAALTPLMRGASSYLALMAGITASVVLIPALVSGANSLDLALARSECTVIGVVVSVLVLALCTPGSALAELYARIDKAGRDARTLAASCFAPLPPEAGALRAFLAELAQLDAGTRQSAAGSLEGYRRMADVDHLLVTCLELIAAAQSLRRAGLCPPQLATPGLQIAPAEHPTLRRYQLAERELLRVPDALARPQRRPGSPLAALTPHREWGQAWRNAAFAGATTAAALLLATHLEWHALELLTLGLCTFVLVLGSAPDARLLAPKLALGVAAGATLGMAYRLGLQPWLGSQTALLVSVLPFIVLGALARTHPRVAIPAIDLNMCFWLASQAGQRAQPDTRRVLVESAALVVAALLMAGAFLLRPAHRNRQSREAIAALRRDLQRMLGDASERPANDWSVRQRSQLLRLALHLTRSPALGRHWPAALLDCLNLGHQLAAGSHDAAVGALLQDWLAQRLPLPALLARLPEDAHALRAALTGAAPLLNLAHED